MAQVHGDTQEMALFATGTVKLLFSFNYFRNWGCTLDGESISSVWNETQKEESTNQLINLEFGRGPSDLMCESERQPWLSRQTRVGSTWVQPFWKAMYPQGRKRD